MSVPDRVLLIDDDGKVRDLVESILAKGGFEVSMAVDAASARKMLDKWVYDLIILDLAIPGDGMELLKEVKAEDEEVEVILVSGHITVEAAVEAMRLGACTIVPKPFSATELGKAVNQALEKRRLALENLYLRQELEKRRHRTQLVYSTKVMSRVMEMVDRVAPTDSTVLLTGESGTGKSLIARRIHEISSRSNGPFVTVDCGTLVETLFESELFGHVKGAFTGADTTKTGKFELANNGTIFFDEISNINLDVQAKLLKAVDDREISKVGSHRTTKVDVRILAATNRNLEEAIKAGAFREDLFYRLNVVSIRVPSLRERREDLPDLVKYFLNLYNQRRNMSLAGLTGETMKLLLEYDWPGNVRELANLIERLVVLGREGVVDVDDLAFAGWHKFPGRVATSNTDFSLQSAEREHIRKVLAHFKGRKSDSASALGIDRKTLREKIRRYGLDQA